jgi:hypothetical protein
MAQKGGQIGQVLGKLNDRRRAWMVFLQEKKRELEQRLGEFGLDVDEAGEQGAGTSVPSQAPQPGVEAGGAGDDAPPPTEPPAGPSTGGEEEGFFDY